jgi:hypothetical protein
MKRVTWVTASPVRPFRYEAAVWRALAQQFAEPPDDTPICVDWGEVTGILPVSATRRGLCYAICTLFQSGRVSDDMYQRMYERLDQFVPFGAYAYEEQTSTNEDFVPNRDARALACLWLALDSQIDP